MPYKNPAKQRQAQREHYLRNKDKFRLRVRERKANLRQYVISIKKNSKCSKCGIDNPVVLAFHHIGDHSKSDTVSNMIRQNRSMRDVKAEIAKCIIICQNCHHKLHALEPRIGRENTRDRYRKKIREYKANLGCSRCGETDPFCLHLHHDDDNKENSVSNMTRTSEGRKQIWEEVKKCIVLCSNCHMAHHYEADYA